MARNVEERLGDVEAERAEAGAAGGAANLQNACLAAIQAALLLCISD
jgi:hypothetical protein